jgi:L-histidine N-alpha-methyltransferase
MKNKDIEVFANDVFEGLSSKNKFISSKYFYDEKGDELFKKIMQMPEYYLTNAEHEIFTLHHDKMIEKMNSKKNGFNLIEFGPGNGYKTKMILEQLYDKRIDFKYIPIDISENVIVNLENDLRSAFPDMKIESRAEDYFHALDDIHEHSEKKLVLFFLGSNIGNLSEEEAIDFLNEIAERLNKDDNLLIGLDLKKDPSKILLAYNDPTGITREFNLNLLERMNRELGSNFDISKFIHYPMYDPETGAAKSYLVSTQDQVVYFEVLEKSFFFEEWELIHTEVSHKYDLEMIDLMAFSSGFRVVKNFYDQRRYFVDSLWVKL